MSVDPATRWLAPLRRVIRVRRRTVLGGVGLGGFLVVALALAGVIGLQPLPHPLGLGAPVERAGPRTAVQPQLGDGLLSDRELRRYPATPATSPAGGPDPGAAASRPADPGQPAGEPAQPDLRGVPGAGQPPWAGLPGGVLPGLPGLTPRPQGPAPGAASPGPAVPRGPGGTGPGRPAPGSPEHGVSADQPRPVTDPACRALLHQPWRAAQAGDAAADQHGVRVADHRDSGRKVLVLHALVRFAGAEAAESGLARLGAAAAGCPAFVAPLPDGTRVTVRLAPLTAPPVTGVDGSFGRAFTATARDRTWTGWLTADRIGGVLSLLTQLAPAGSAPEAELAATRQAAVDKARTVATG
ncbi:MAG TPA: hypothetical protein VNV66_03185 [Pilimelia sp.]|nr:hypothetical protein [Pilimelia sp.]